MPEKKTYAAMPEKKRYAAPRIVRHGDAVEQTHGLCHCRAESTAFKHATDEL